MDNYWYQMYYTKCMHDAEITRLRKEIQKLELEKEEKKKKKKKKKKINLLLILQQK